MKLSKKQKEVIRYMRQGNYITNKNFFMREIKFRAFDKLQKKMFYPVGLQNFKFYADGSWDFVGNPTLDEEETITCDTSDGDLAHVFDGVIMQYTGLKDKNGKEIYEGDYDEDFSVVTWCDNKHGWTLSTYDFPTKDFIHCNCYNCEGNYEIDEQPIEIIGNIYENPEFNNQ